MIYFTETACTLAARNLENKIEKEKKRTISSQVSVTRVVSARARAACSSAKIVERFAARTIPSVERNGVDSARSKGSRAWKACSSAGGRAGGWPLHTLPVCREFRGFQLTARGTSGGSLTDHDCARFSCPRGSRKEGEREERTIVASFASMREQRTAARRGRVAVASRRRFRRKSFVRLRAAYIWFIFV